MLKTRDEKIDEIVNKFMSLIYSNGWNSHIQSHINRITSTKSAQIIFNKLLKKIIATGNAKFIYNYALQVQSLSHQSKVELIDALIQHDKCGGYICYFAKDIKGLTREDIIKLMRAEIETHNAQFICKFALCVSGLTNEDKSELARGMTKADSKFNCIDKDGNVPEELALAKLNHSLDDAHGQHILHFATQVSGLSYTDKVELMVAEIETGDAEDIFWFARNVEGLTHEDKVKLLDAEIETRHVYFIVDFAEMVEGLTINDFCKIKISLDGIGNSYGTYHITRLFKEKFNLTDDEIEDCIKDYNLINKI